MKERFVSSSCTKHGWEMKLKESFYWLQSGKKLNKTNSTTPVITSLLYSMPRALGKVCVNLISRN